jgi:hypothetical protein
VFFGRKEFDTLGLGERNACSNSECRSHLIDKLWVYPLCVKRNFPERVESFNR